MHGGFTIFASSWPGLILQNAEMLFIEPLIYPGSSQNEDGSRTKINSCFLLLSDGLQWIDRVRWERELDVFSGLELVKRDREGHVSLLDCWLRFYASYELS
jgi:hypothetical protein